MFVRSGANCARSVAGPARTFATLREIEMRLKSIKNIEKITKTMKIVASTRLSKAERAKVTAREYSSAERQFYDSAETKPLEGEGEKKDLVIAVTSDKGLCGSIHSQLSKAVRNYLAKTQVRTSWLSVTRSRLNFSELTATASSWLSTVLARRPPLSKSLRS